MELFVIVTEPKIRGSKRVYRFPEQLQFVISVIRRHSRDVCFGHVHLHGEKENGMMCWLTAKPNLQS